MLSGFAVHSYPVSCSRLTPPTPAHHTPRGTARKQRKRVAQGRAAWYSRSFD